MAGSCRTGLTIGLCLAAVQVCAQPVSNELFYAPDYGFSGNLSLVSNYVFRGETRSDDKPAIQGGIDYDSPAGFYVGTWASSGDKNVPLEIDVYGAFTHVVNERLDFEAKLTGYIYPHATEDNSLEAAVTAYYAITGVRYNYDFVLEEHYLETGVYHDLTDSLRARLRAGVLHRDKPPANSTTTAKEPNPWDIQLSLTYSLNAMSSFSADYSYHENERSNVAIGYTASF